MKNMSKTATIQIRIEPEIKADVERILREMGLTLSQAVGIFFRRVRLERGIPFPVKIPSKKTLRAMKDAEAGRYLRGPFDTVQDLMADLERDK